MGVYYGQRVNTWDNYCYYKSHLNGLGNRGRESGETCAWKKGLHTRGLRLLDHGEMKWQDIKQAVN